MQESSICKSTDHLFLPVLEVHDPLLRCVHCNVFAYHETVKQLAKRRSYSIDEEEPVLVEATPFVKGLWRAIVRICSSVFFEKSSDSRARAAN